MGQVRDMDADMDANIVHSPEQSRFETESGEAFLTYEQSDGTVVFTHTIVPPEMSGQGVAGELATAGVGWARGEGHAVEAQCAYVRGWLEKHG